MKSRNRSTYRLLALISLLFVCMMLFISCDTVEDPPKETNAPTDAPNNNATGTPTDAPTEPHVHEFGEWTVVTEATCTAAGLSEGL